MNENTMQMEFTGERFVPEEHGDIELEHLHRYFLACEICTGKVVLDIASGEGYGSAMLANKADKVYGVDISIDAIEHARIRYYKDNLEYIVGSCANIPLPDASVDMVVSFETIEHHDQHEKMLQEIKRVLRPDGLLLISSPDKYNYSIVPGYQNEFHTKELYIHEFKQLIGHYFTNIAYFGQRIIYGSGIFAENLQTTSLNYLQEDSAIKSASAMINPLYWIALASNNVLPDFSTGVFEQPINDTDKFKSLAAHVSLLTQTIDSLIVDRDSYRDAYKEALAERDLQNAKRILLVSYYCPSRAHAGGLRILDIYNLIKTYFPGTKIDLYTYKRPEIDWSYSDVESLFDNIYISPTEDLLPSDFSMLSGNISQSYDVIDLQFHQAANHLKKWRSLGGKILFTPIESLVGVFAINLKAIFQGKSAFSLPRIITEFKSAVEEIVYSSLADEVICVSKTDAYRLRRICRTKNINSIETGLSFLEFPDAINNLDNDLKPELKTNTIVYVAYFGSETNIIALKWYLDKVHALIEQSVPNYKLQIVGRGDLSVFNDYRSNSIEFIGEVPSLIPAIEQAKIGIAPALSGSGLRGKISQYALFGVPSVASPISAKGLVYKDGVDIFIADDPTVFAERCITLLKNNELNKEMGRLARETAISNYSWKSKIEEVRQVYELDKI